MTVKPIPAKLRYYRKAAVQIHQIDSTFNNKKTRMVRPTFVVDADNVKTNATARNWASGYQGKDGYDEEVVNNDPIEAVEIIRYERRGRGGRAWKVLVDGAFYVDLKEDVLEEALVKGDGVEQAHLKGPFIWASGSGGLRLTRYNSSFHKRAEQVKERSKVRVKAKDLKIGNIYETPAGTQAVYLGRVDMDYILAHYNPWKFSVSKNVHLWYNTSWSTLGGTYGTKGLYRLATYKTRQMSVSVGSVELNKDPIELIRELAEKSLEEELQRIANLPKIASGSYAYGQISDADRAKLVTQTKAHHWQYLTIRKPGQPRPDVPALQEIAQVPAIKDNL